MIIRNGHQTAGIAVSAVVIVVFAAACAFGAGQLQNESSTSVQDLVKALCAGKQNLTNYIDPDDLKLSGRLGISYDGMPFKSLIAHDLDSAVKAGISDGRLKYETTTTPLQSGYSSLTVTCPSINYEAKFILRNGKLVIPSSYYIRDWKRIDSDHFEFIVEDTLALNPYSMQRLEEFFAHAAQTLELSPKQLETIREQKIQYVLCKDPEEVSLLTGYESRGIYELASDRIITCYKCHYHELVHLLVNFKLGTSPLYTHPFLQEGIAVALGGRGGKEPEVIVELGASLAGSGLADVQDLFSYDGFVETHPSISYPLSGAYCGFLLNELGLAQFLALYRNSSGSESEVSKMTLEAGALPDDTAWKEFIGSFSGNHLIEPGGDETKGHDLFSDSALVVSEIDKSHYSIGVRDTVLLGADASLARYESQKFFELFGARKYKGEKYALIAGPQEIQVYNLYTDNLIANLVCSFRTGLESVPYEDQYYRFEIRKSVLPDLSDLLRRRSKL